MDDHSFAISILIYENKIVSSINHAKAEAQKLIKKYNKLQAEARAADTREESKRKAAEAEKLVSQISSLQSAIAQLQGRESKVVDPKIPAEKEESATPFEDRINHIKEAQKKTRLQIEQLTTAKEQLEDLLKREKEKNARAAQGKINNDERLQKELAILISKKEAEHKSLKQELESIRKEAESIRKEAKKETDLVKIQRDAARAVMEKQKELELEKSLISRNYRRNRGVLAGIIIGVIFSLIAGVIFLMPWLKEQGLIPTLIPKEIKPETPPVVVKEEPSIEPKEKVVTTMKPLGFYRDRLKRGGYGPLMAKLPGGSFKMGSQSTLPFPDERPQHGVTLESFSFSRYEITFEEYDQFVESTGQPSPDDNGWGRKKRPVINVNWYEATEYTKWLTEQTGHQYRLPSEREWEYAAGANAETLYWWGYKVGKNNANCALCGSAWDGKKTAPVGSFSPNPFAIYDSIGNVMEWTISCYRASYQGAPAIGNRWKGGDCSWQVVRSSSYKSSENGLRTTKRNKFHPNTRIETLGIRVVRTD